MCMIVLPACMCVYVCVCVPHVCLVPKEILVREGIGSPGSRVIDKAMSHHVDHGN